nr:fibronectin type III domain-containing protein 1-like [Nomia melanderi]
MRNLILLATCLSLIAVAWGNLIEGWHQPGEIIVNSQVIRRPRIIGRPNIATCTGVAPPGYEISFIIVTTPNPWIVRLSVAKGGLQSDYAVVSAIGRPSWGFVIKCIIFAAPSDKTTTPKTTTQKTTTQKTTTQKTTTQKTTTQKTTTEKTTTPQTTTENNANTTSTWEPNTNTTPTWEPTSTPAPTTPSPTASSESTESTDESWKLINDIE